MKGIVCQFAKYTHLLSYQEPVKLSFHEDQKKLAWLTILLLQGSLMHTLYICMYVYLTNLYKNHSVFCQKSPHDGIWPAATTMNMSTVWPMATQWLFCHDYINAQQSYNNFLSQLHTCAGFGPYFAQLWCYHGQTNKHLEMYPKWFHINSRCSRCSTNMCQGCEVLIPTPNFNQPRSYRDQVLWIKTNWCLSSSMFPHVHS